jgi:cyclic pyranopterin phosphate synthase
MSKKGKVFSLNLSQKKGIAKTPVESVELIENFGVCGDAHAQAGTKQVSLLAIESIRSQNQPDKPELQAGDFAENITTQGLDLVSLKIGDQLKIGNDVILSITKIGKDCHKYCAIYYKLGDCIMPREGIFAKVIQGGLVKPGYPIELVA